MCSSDDQEAEELAAVENLQRASDRRQHALFALIKQSIPQGDGQLTSGVLEELDAAEVDWKIADAEVERIATDIQMGRRR